MNDQERDQRWQELIDEVTRRESHERDMVRICEAKDRHTHALMHAERAGCLAELIELIERKRPEPAGPYDAIP